MRRTLSRFGGFVIYDRVVCDWRQFLARDDAHVNAKERLAKALDDSSSAATSTSSSSSAAASSISVDEANGLLQTFTRSHNAEAATQVIRMIREDLQQPLDVRHFHSLIRVFAFDRDKENLEQLFAAVFDRRLTTHETYARYIDTIHCLAPKDATSRILEMIAGVQEAYGTLAVPLAHPTVVPGVVGTDATTHQSASSDLSSPILTSLLHHVSHDVKFPPIISFVVAAWIQSLGVKLCDWDYASILVSLIAKPQGFPTLRRALGALSDVPSTGHCRLSSLLRQVHLLGGAVSPAHDVLRCVERLNQALPSYDAEFDSGIVNLRIASLPQMVQRVLHHASFSSRGVGAQRTNPAALTHFAALVYSTLKYDSEAVALFTTAHAWQKEWCRKYPDASHRSLAELQCEDFTISPYFILDIGNLLPKMSDTLLLSKSFASTYASVAEDVATAASDFQVSVCGANALLLIRSDSEARQAWSHILAAVDSPPADSPGTNSRIRVPHSVRALVKKFVEFCSRHPLANCKMTAKGLAERERWGLYLESRDTALALFGQVRQARDVMRHLFYNKGVQQALRNDVMVQRDIADTCAVFGLTPPTVDATTGAPVFKRFQRPHVLSERCSVPAHLHDANVPNPYPHCRLKRRSLGSRLSAREDIPSEQLFSQQLEPSDVITEDFFPMVWTALMSSSSSVGGGQWFLHDPEMYMLLLHCLVQRLDWEAAVQLTLRSTPNFEMTFLMDQEIQQYFNEVGDPIGALAFKTATKLYDARILPDTLSRRESFHKRESEEQSHAKNAAAAA